MIGRDFSQVFDGHVLCLQKVEILPVAEKMIIHMAWQPINKWNEIPLFLGNITYDDGNIHNRGIHLYISQQFVLITRIMPLLILSSPSPQFFSNVLILDKK